MQKHSNTKKTYKLQEQSGAVLVEAAIAMSVFLLLIITGLYYGNHLNTHSVMESAARNASRRLANYTPVSGAAAGYTFSDSDYLDFAAQGIAVARKYMQVAGYDPEHFTYRVSTLAVPGDSGASGKTAISENFQEIEIAISNIDLKTFELSLCARSKFKYELPFSIGHYTGNVSDAC